MIRQLHQDNKELSSIVVNTKIENNEKSNLLIANKLTDSKCQSDILELLSLGLKPTRAEISKIIEVCDDNYLTLHCILLQLTKRGFDLILDDNGQPNALKLCSKSDKHRKCVKKCENLLTRANGNGDNTCENCLKAFSNKKSLDQHKKQQH